MYWVKISIFVKLITVTEIYGTLIWLHTGKINSYLYVMLPFKCTTMKTWILWGTVTSEVQVYIKSNFKNLNMLLC